METHVLQAGDELPDLEGRTLDGQPVHYREVWQKKAMILVTLPAPAPDWAVAYREALSRHPVVVGQLLA